MRTVLIATSGHGHGHGHVYGCSEFRDTAYRTGGIGRRRGWRRRGWRRNVEGIPRRRVVRLGEHLVPEVDRGVRLERGSIVDNRGKVELRVGGGGVTGGAENDPIVIVSALVLDARGPLGPAVGDTGAALSAARRGYVGFEMLCIAPRARHEVNLRVSTLVAAVDSVAHADAIVGEPFVVGRVRRVILDVGGIRRALERRRYPAAPIVVGNGPKDRRCPAMGRPSTEFWQET